MKDSLLSVFKNKISSVKTDPRFCVGKASHIYSRSVLVQICSKAGHQNENEASSPMETGIGLGSSVVLANCVFQISKLDFVFLAIWLMCFSKISLFKMVLS